jgi:hypothetical protein
MTSKMEQLRRRSTTRKTTRPERRGSIREKTIETSRIGTSGDYSNTKKEEVFKIFFLEIEPQTKLVEEEVKIVEMKTHVKTTKLKVGIEPLVVVHVEIIIKETNV